MLISLLGWLLHQSLQSICELISEQVVLVHILFYKFYLIANEKNTNICSKMH